MQASSKLCPNSKEWSNVQTNLNSNEFRRTNTDIGVGNSVRKMNALKPLQQAEELYSS